MDEATIVARAQAKDEDAFTWLVDRYGELLLSLVSYQVGRGDAPDLVQEIWVAVYRKLWQLDDCRLFVPWLKKVAYYRCLNYRKARARQRTVELQMDTEAWLSLSECLSGDDANVEELLEQSELRALIAEQLDRLPADYGQLLRLHYLKQLSYERIVALTALPLSTVKWRLHQGRKLLYARLLKLFDTAEPYQLRKRIAASGVRPRFDPQATRRTINHG